MTEENKILIFDSTEKAALSDIAKSNKFSYIGVSVLYPDNIQEKVTNFDKAIRFIMNLRNAHAITQPLIIQKIDDFLISNHELIKKNKMYLIELKAEVNYNLDKIEDEINRFFLDNKNIIESLIDTCFELGKSIKYYNPDESGGYMSSSQTSPTANQ